MDQEKYQGIGNMNYGGIQPAERTRKDWQIKHPETGRGSKLLLSVCVIVLLLAVVLVVIVTNNGEKKQIRTADHACEIIAKMMSGTIEEKDIQWMAKCYPESCPIREGIEEMLETGEELEELEEFGEIGTFTYKRQKVEKIEKAELEKYGAHIGKMEGMKKQDVKVDSGSWITYEMSFEDEEAVVKLLVLKCNGKFGVWGYSEEEGGTDYFWEDY